MQVKVIILKTEPWTTPCREVRKGRRTIKKKKIGRVTGDGEGTTKEGQLGNQMKTGVSR